MEGTQVGADGTVPQYPLHFTGKDPRSHKYAATEVALSLSVDGACELNITTSWTFFDSGTSYYSFGGKHQIDLQNKTIHLDVINSVTQEQEIFLCQYETISPHSFVGLFISLLNDYIGWHGTPVPGLVLYVPLIKS